MFTTLITCPFCLCLELTSQNMKEWGKKFPIHRIQFWLFVFNSNKNIPYSNVLLCRSREYRQSQKSFYINQVWNTLSFMFRLTYKETSSSSKLQRENYTCVTFHLVFVSFDLTSQSGFLCSIILGSLCIICSYMHVMKYKWDHNANNAKVRWGLTRV